MGAGKGKSRRVQTVIITPEILEAQEEAVLRSLMEATGYEDEGTAPVFYNSKHVITLIDTMGRTAPFSDVERNPMLGSNVEATLKRLAQKSLITKREDAFGVNVYAAKENKKVRLNAPEIDIEGLIF